MNTKLITAEEWQLRYNNDRSRPTDQRLLRSHNGDYIRAIQLNAAKWGMEQAAQMLLPSGDRQNILIVAESLELPKD